MAPGSTNTAWVAFRAPLVPATNRTFALIVPVLNFATLAVSGAGPGSAVFGTAIELDLYGRGIRSIEGTTNGYILSAGPPGDVAVYPNDFRLFTWSGDPAEQPQQRAADLAGLLPEGIAELPSVPWDAQTQVQLITDNGTTIFYNDGLQNKHLPVDGFKKFRSDWVALGAIVDPIPVITAVQANGTNVSLTWRALKGLAYQVQTNSGLGGTQWSDSGDPFLAGGPFVTAIVPAPSPGAAFYRVRIVSSPL
jgi:hypothetical protein